MPGAGMGAGRTAERATRPQPSPLGLFLGALIAEAGLAALPLDGWRLLPWGLTGIVPLIAGLALTLAADRRFARAGTTVKPFRKPSVLVTHGPFRITRNPMYLGLVFMLGGLAILLGSPLSFCIAPAYAWLVQQRFIVHEERMLEQRFGDAFRAYCERVRRWV